MPGRRQTGALSLVNGMTLRTVGCAGQDACKSRDEDATHRQRRPEPDVLCLRHSPLIRGGLCETPGSAVSLVGFRNFRKIGDTPKEITSNGFSGR
jgi:hypothetical protein